MVHFSSLGLSLDISCSFCISNFYAKVSLSSIFFSVVIFILYILTRSCPCTKNLQSMHSFSEACLASKFSGFFSLSSFLNYFTSYIKAPRCFTNFSGNLLPPKSIFAVKQTNVIFFLTTKFCLSKVFRLALKHLPFSENNLRFFFQV